MDASGEAGSPREGWGRAWAAALDDLELDVAQAERMLGQAHRDVSVATGPWVAPAGLGPLPASLEARARALLERQLATAHALGLAAVRSRRQLRIHEALTPPTEHPPVYLDVDG